VVTDLGMDFVYIPVDFHHPAVSDFRLFGTTMNSAGDAKKDLDSVWTPDETWFRFLRSVLEDYGRSHECAGCDWGEHEFIED